MRVLFVTPYVPSPVRVRSYYWIKYLAALGHEIVLATLVDGHEAEASLAELRKVCVRVLAVASSPSRMVWNALKALPGGEPIQLACMRHPALERLIGTELSRGTFDVAHVEHLRGAAFAEAIAGVPIVFDAVDSISLLFEQTQRLGPRLQDRLMARLDRRRTERFEASILDRFARVLVTAAADADHLVRLAGRPARPPVVLPNAVDLTYFRPASDPRETATLLFVGKMSYHANIAAARFLVQDVMPVVWRDRPETVVRIVGQAPDRSVRALAGDERVTVTGRVADLRPWLGRATLSVCPMPYGVGVQNKVLEAMATATPVVAAAQAARALMAMPGRDLVVADAAEEFGRQILALLASPERRAELGLRGRAHVEAHYSGEALAARLESTYREAIPEKAGSR